MFIWTAWVVKSQIALTSESGRNTANKDNETYHHESVFNENFSLDLQK